MKLVDLDGIGVKTALLFEKLNIYNVEDLLTYFPRDYVVLKRTNMDIVGDKDRVVLDGVIEFGPTIMQVSSNLKRVMFRISDNKGIYNVIVYNQVYLMKELKSGISVIVIGKYDKFRNNIVASEVRIGKLPSGIEVEPIYRLTSGINNKLISRVIDKALNSNIRIDDYVPNYLVDRYKFLDKMNAIREVHYPSNSRNYKRALQRLKYEEFFLYLAKIRYLRYFNDTEGSLVCGKVFDKELVNKFIESLSFELTSDQLDTIRAIERDMVSDRPMNRLVQGDVGSGKTIVAFIAGYMNYLAGFQTALMVPTEILAEQHYQSAISLFKNTDMRIELLTSSLTKKKRDSVLKKIESGYVDFVIGTQSLIQKDVIYKSLGLIIADEQHRFGVNQRNLLKGKGNFPDVLSMSATPIPRTYALTIYGDMDVSSIKTKPKGRKEVSTIVKNEKEILEVLKLMKVEIDKGHQVYVVVPAIDNDDLDELDNVNKLRDKMNIAFGKLCKIGCVYGKMDALEKANVMNSFSNGDIKILISTTVIEVGVNVPNASMIVIFQANLFGLSTLHQLRGRVGRGDIQSYCVLVSKVECDRLKLLEKTSDGFVVSEYDFKNRGEGDLFGVRQSGQAQFKLADLRRDFELLVRVKKDVDEFFDKCISNGKCLEYIKYLDDNKFLN